MSFTFSLFICSSKGGKKSPVSPPKDRIPFSKDKSPVGNRDKKSPDHHVNHRDNEAKPKPIVQSRTDHGQKHSPEMLSEEKVAAIEERQLAIINKLTHLKEMITVIHERCMDEEAEAECPPPEKIVSPGPDPDLPIVEA
jgi:hypothetical protein